MSAKKLKIHFIGIGGIGVSALAKYYLEKGHKISGSDIASGKHSPKNIPQSTDLVIYSPAVKSDNPEIKEAKRRKIKIQSYPEALGELTKNYFTIAVSGTHGKSTTTAMLGILLLKAGLDPTVIIGTKVKEFENSNCRVGKGDETKVSSSSLADARESKYLVIEADEHFASFLNYSPDIAIITNIEADHLDYYKNLNNILKTFKKYVGNLPKDGLLIANKDDKNIRKIVGRGPASLIYYSGKQKEAKKLKKILTVPGDHNVYNALAALATARALKIPDKVSFKALSEYKGSWRRFEEKSLKVGKSKLKIISDYGHHPTEIKATLKAAREKYPKKKIWCVYQPHQYQRTFYLFNDFVKVLRQTQDKYLADKIIITDIYDVAGREEKKIKKQVNSEKLAEITKKKNVIYLPKGKILGYIRKNAKEFDVLIIMGAGDIYKLVDSFGR